MSRKLMPEFRDPEFAAAVIISSNEEMSTTFEPSDLNQVIEAHGFAEIAKATKLSRAAVHQIVSKNGNPSFRNLERILRVLGLKITIEPIEKNLDRKAVYARDQRRKY